MLNSGESSDEVSEFAQALGVLRSLLLHHNRREFGRGAGMQTASEKALFDLADRGRDFVLFQQNRGMDNQLWRHATQFHPDDVEDGHLHAEQECLNPESHNREEEKQEQQE